MHADDGCRRADATVAELVELRWLDRDQIEGLMPDLHHSVCRYLRLRFILHTTPHGFHC